MTREESSLIVQKVLFFSILGGTMGTVVGGVIGLARGVPLQRTLPSAIFRTAAFTGTISATQSVLERIREKDDVWNKVMAGGWTGFIFGQSLFKRGFAGGVNGAVFNVLVQSLSLSGMKDSFSHIVHLINPLVDDDVHAQLHERIGQLKSEIESLKQ